MSFLSLIFLFFKVLLVLPYKTKQLCQCCNEPCHPQSAELSKEVSLHSETLVTSKSEIGEIRRTLQTLEIKLQAQLSKVTKKRLSDNNYSIEKGITLFGKRLTLAILFSA